MERLDLYRCEICGNLVEVILAGDGELVCCNQPMKKLEAHTDEQAILEKHVPIFSFRDDGNEEIRVGEVLHPMTEEHHIMFVEAISDDRKISRLEYLYPGEEPRVLTSAEFKQAREYCNIHGLWEGHKND